jgi:hypothetical protein
MTNIRPKTNVWQQLSSKHACVSMPKQAIFLFRLHYYTLAKRIQLFMWITDVKYFYWLLYTIQIIKIENKSRIFSKASKQNFFFGNPCRILVFGFRCITKCTTTVFIYCKTITIVAFASKSAFSSYPAFERPGCCSRRQHNLLLHGGQ